MRAQAWDPQLTPAANDWHPSGAARIGRIPRPASLYFTLAIAALLAAGCQQKMANQPSYKPDDPSEFYPDGKSARPVVAGTVARGHLRIDSALFTGRTPAAAAAAGGAQEQSAAAEESEHPLLAAEAREFTGVVDEFPFPLTPEILEHGRNRFLIYCVVCHDAVGTGLGKIVERGYTRPPSYHIERLRKAPAGYFFRVITRGYGSMPSYAAQVPVRDRWAIVAYIRALQLSQRFPEDKLPPELRREWDEQQKMAQHEGQQP